MVMRGMWEQALPIPTQPRVCGAVPVMADAACQPHERIHGSVGSGMWNEEAAGRRGARARARRDRETRQAREATGQEEAEPEGKLGEGTL